MLACPLPPGPVPLLLAAIIAAVVAAVLRRAEPLVFVLGFAIARHAVVVGLEARLAPALEGRTLAITGVVDSVPQYRAEGVRFQFATRSLPGVPPRIELTWYDGAWVPRPAERLSLEVKLRRPRGFANPGGMDAEARMLRDRIGATGYVRSARSEGRTWIDVLRRPLLVARGRVYEALRSALGDRPATGIVAGLAVGLQDAVSAEQWRALARSGTSHLMAISGTHVGMFGLMAAWIALRIQCWRQRRGALGTRRDVAVAVGAIAAFVYALLAGWSVPTQRTAIMIALVATAFRCRRRVAVADALALGALAVLLLDPLAPLASGFWLSFGAVAAILFVAGGHVTRPTGFRGFAEVQLAVTLGLLPVLVASFGAVSLVSAPVNLLAIPLYTLLLVPAIVLATAVLMVAPVAGATALAAVAWFVETTWPLIATPAGWPIATWGMAALPPSMWIVLVVGVIAALAPLPAPGRAAALLMIASAMAWRAPPPAPGAARVTVLDVGQGLAVVVQTRRHVLVYDTGPAFRSGSDTGALVVEPYLRSRGLRRVDRLVASHDDGDHVGGAGSLAKAVPVDSLVASGRALDAIGPVARCRAGEGWSWDGVRFDWLHPGEPLLAGDNDGSCVLAVEAGGHRFVLAGDVERAAEQQLVERGLAAAEVVVVPHHGSRTSSTPPFVAALAANWAVVSAGYRNRWGFPRAEIVERWRSSGARVVQTSSSGAIEFEALPGQPMAAPGEWRPEHRRAWTEP